MILKLGASNIKLRTLKAERRDVRSSMFSVQFFRFTSSDGSSKVYPSKRAIASAARRLAPGPPSEEITSSSEVLIS